MYGRRGASGRNSGRYGAQKDTKKKDVNEFPGVSEDELTELKEAFDLFDKDGGGTIDGKELKAAVESLGFDQSNRMIQYLIAEMKEQEMEFHDFVHLMTAHASEGSEEDIRKVFELYDVDGTNYISIENLRHIAKQLGESTSDKDLQEMISRVDTTGRGHVTFPDFLAIMTKKRDDAAE
jgi:Ca2+-binding EF-hand superfamily protein